jgi:hypothetical protein
VITVNAALSEWLVRRGVAWRFRVTQFLAMAVVNTAVALIFRVLLPVSNGSFRLANVLFFALLLTVLVTLYDGYRPLHEARRASATRAKASPPPRFATRAPAR